MKFNAFKCPACGTLCASPSDAPVCSCGRQMEIATEPEDLFTLDRLVREKLKQACNVRVPIHNHIRPAIVEEPIPSRCIESGPCAAVIMRRRS